MSEGCFWMIYFVLLHSRLSKQDAELLSMPQIAEAWTALLQLQNRSKADYETSSRGQPYRDADITMVSPWGQVTSCHLTCSLESNPVNLYPFESPTSSSTSYLETEKHAVHTTEAEIIDKLVADEDPATKIKTNDLVNNFISIHDYDENEDEWPEAGAAVISRMMMMNRQQL